MTSTSAKPLPKNEAQSLRELAKLTLQLQAASALYGAARDGLMGDVDRDINDLEGYDLDAHMADAENDVAQMIADGLREEVNDMDAFDRELDANDPEEEKMLQDDEADPEEEGKKLAAAGETE